MVRKPLVKKHKQTSFYVFAVRTHRSDMKLRRKIRFIIRPVRN